MSVSEGDVALIDDFLMSTMTRAAEPVRTGTTLSDLS
jgi:hypothetical protein